MDISNKTVLITGGNKGIGFAMAEAFAKRNCKLILIARTELSPGKIKRLTELSGSEPRFISCDLSDESAIDKMCSDFQSENLSIDVLVNNAGLLAGGLYEEQEMSHIRKVLRVNTESVLRLTHHFLPQMLKRNSGLIVNNASVSGKFFVPTSNTYAASKAAVVAFTESLEMELKPTGVNTLLLITPGIQTDMYNQINDMYKNLDYEAKDGIPPEVWAEKMIRAIEKEDSLLTPDLSNEAWWGLKISQYFPSLFKSIALQKFKR